MSIPLLLLVGTLVTWRVTRFIVADDLIDGTRKKVLTWLNQDRGSKKANFLPDKLYYLITCPWCVSIYVSAGFLLLTRLICVDSIPMPVWMWLAISGASIIPYQFADGDWIVSLTKHEDH